MKKENSNCTATTSGTVVNIKVKGQDFPTMISVSYIVNGATYELTESIKLKSEKVKLGFLTIGQKRVAVMRNTTVGSVVRVNYTPANPAESYLTDNIGKANV